MASIHGGEHASSKMFSFRSASNSTAGRVVEQRSGETDKTAHAHGSTPSSGLERRGSRLSRIDANLHKAAGRSIGAVDEVRRLLTAGGNPNARIGGPLRSTTSVYEAARKGNLLILGLLLSHGGNPAECRKGLLIASKTPKTAALDHDQRECADLLVQAESNATSAEAFEFEHNVRSKVVTWASAIADRDLQTQTYETALKSMLDVPNGPLGAQAQRRFLDDSIDDLSALFQDRIDHGDVDTASILLGTLLMPLIGQDDRARASAMLDQLDGLGPKGLPALLRDVAEASLRLSEGNPARALELVDGTLESLYRATREDRLMTFAARLALQALECMSESERHVLPAGRQVTLRAILAGSLVRSVESKLQFCRDYDLAVPNVDAPMEEALLQLSRAAGQLLSNPEAADAGRLECLVLEQYGRVMSAKGDQGQANLIFRCARDRRDGVCPEGPGFPPRAALGYLESLADLQGELARI